MVGVTTIALLERRPDIGRDLFSRYWRDVHGVMAARIPGFWSYTQHHVTPLEARFEPFEGIAVVTFAREEDRQGLATSAMSAHIHRDERNVFRRALLYSLAPGSDAVLHAGQAEGEARFVVVPEGSDAAAVSRAIEAEAPQRLVRYDLTTGDPAAWNDTDVDERGRARRFTTLFHAVWPGAAPAIALDDAVPAYRLDETHAMVEHGRPTPVGLRGLDAVRTIREAGADNQLSPEVEHALYGDPRLPR